MSRQESSGIRSDPRDTGVGTRAARAQRSAAPAFQVDPMWPKMPRQWIWARCRG
jgi:hypothetical protein